MFSSSANAAGGASSGMAGLVSFTPLLLIFIIMYVLILRPQQQAVKRLRAKIDNPFDLKLIHTVRSIGYSFGEDA